VNVPVATNVAYIKAINNDANGFENKDIEGRKLGRLMNNLSASAAEEVYARLLPQLEAQTFGGRTSIPSIKTVIMTALEMSFMAGTVAMFVNKNHDVEDHAALDYAVKTYLQGD
jgi:hypothetical protein